MLVLKRMVFFKTIYQLFIMLVLGFGPERPFGGSSFLVRFTVKGTRKGYVKFSLSYGSMHPGTRSDPAGSVVFGPASNFGVRSDTVPFIELNLSGREDLHLLGLFKTYG